MKQIIFIFLIAVFSLITPSYAEAKLKSPKESFRPFTPSYAEDGLRKLKTNESPRNGKPFVYEMEKNGKTIILLGTMHFGVSLSELPCSDDILERLKASDLLFSETSEEFLTVFRHFTNHTEKFLWEFVRGGKEMLSRISETQKAAVMEAMTSIVDQARKDTQIQLDNFQFVDKIKEEPFEDLSPPARAILTVLGADIQGNSMDFLRAIILYYGLRYFTNLLQGMDVKIMDIAHSYNIPIKALDNLGMSVKTFSYEETEERKTAEIEIDSRVIDITATTLMSDAVHRNSEFVLSPLKTAYLSGDEEVVLRKLYQNSDFSSLNNSVMSARNETWFQRLKAAFESHEYENIFLAGGLFHLIGYSNVLDKLREDGFTVRRLACSENK